METMRKKIILLIFLCASLQYAVVCAQDCDISIGIALPDQPEAVPVAARGYLTNKLRQMATANHIGVDTDFTQFILSAKIDILNKEILPGPPMQHAYTLLISLYMVDNYNRLICSSATTEVKAVGINETKAYMDGIRRISVKSKEIQSFIAEGEQKVMLYYDGNYQKILDNAQTQIAMKQYTTAIYMALSIPSCSKGYAGALVVATRAYQQYVDGQCQELLAKARSAWITQQNADGAMEAGEYLKQIYPDAACHAEALKLYNEIESQVQRDLKFDMKKYNDAVSIDKQRIEAIKAIGIAYGKGQKEKTETTNLMWIK